MSEFCGGLQGTLDYYDFVFELKSETVEKNVMDIFKQVGVNESDATTLINSFVKQSKAESQHITN